MAHENEKTLSTGVVETKISKDKHFRSLDRLWPPEQFVEVDRWFVVDTGFKDDTQFVTDILRIIRSGTVHHLAFANAERTVRNMMMYETIRRVAEEHNVDMWIGSRCVTFASSYDWLADQIAILLAEAKSRRLSEASGDKWEIIATHGYIYRNNEPVGFTRKAGYTADAKQRGYPVEPNEHIDDMCQLARVFDAHGRRAATRSAQAYRLGLRSWGRVKAALLDFTYAGLIPYANKYVRFPSYDHLKDDALVGRVYNALQPRLQRTSSGRTSQTETGFDEAARRGAEESGMRTAHDTGWLKCPACNVNAKSSGTKVRDAVDTPRFECPKCGQTLTPIKATTFKNIRNGHVCERCGEARNDRLNKRNKHLKCLSCGHTNQRPNHHAADSPAPSHEEKEESSDSERNAS